MSSLDRLIRERGLRTTFVPFPDGIPAPMLDAESRESYGDASLARELAAEGIARVSDMGS